MDADYLDTETFMNGSPAPRGGSVPIGELLSRLERYIAPWWEPDTDLNRRRCAILRQCLTGGSQWEKGLYTLTVPTGGGKTVSSLAFALSMAKAQGMSRVVYVIPYTSIVDQTAAVFSQILGEENVLELTPGRLCCRRRGFPCRLPESIGHRKLGCTSGGHHGSAVF